MAYGTPSDPVGGTVITVAYAVANLLDPIRWLRLMTGNADPPGSSYVVVSDSTSGTSWRKIPADALAPGAALSNLGYTPLNVAGGTMEGPISFGQSLGAKLNLWSTTFGFGINANELTGYLPAGAAFRLRQGAWNGTSLGEVWHDSNTTSRVTNSKIADSAVTGAKIDNNAVSTGKLADSAVTSAKIDNGTIQTADIADGQITNAKLASGAAAANLGYTPARIASGSYSGNNVSSGRHITTGFATRLVIIFAKDGGGVDLTLVSTTTSEALRTSSGGGGTIAGSASVHLHGSDGFVVGDGTTDGNASGFTYTWTAFG